ncbi:SDR family oxidoreductase [Spongiimicrobium salis]|uniref:SDR family oxidoreductase n=1 Tax=Spongiimicrobium salis TaxID=1667022 RepID=UPI00374CC4A5
MILVTGGTGMVGAHLLFQLLNKNNSTLRATHRKNSNLQHVKHIFSYYSQDAEALFERIHWVEADITDIPSLDIAFEGVTHVYHCAALISFDPNDFDALKKINIEGTANVANLCIAHNIAKLCYVSTIAAVGKSLGGAKATEENEWTDSHANVYGLTKNDAEMEVWRAGQEGVPIVIVNPGLIIGPGYWNSGSGVLFRQAYKNRGYYPPSGTGVIVVQDVVDMMIQLMESSIVHERFISIAENLSFQEILTKVAKGFDKAPPKTQLRFWQLEILWRLDWVGHLFSSKGRKLSRKTVTSLRDQEIYDNTKIINALQYSFSPLDEAITFACAAFKKENP